MDGHRLDQRVVPEDRLDPIAVMDVGVNVEHAMPGVARPPDRDGDVVEHAESARTRGERVVESAARVEGVEPAPFEDLVHRRERPADHRRTGLVHPVEGWRVVVRHALLVGHLGVVGQPLDAREETARVNRGEVGVRGGRGREEGRRIGPELAQQVDPRPEPPRRERVSRTEVVRVVRGAVDDERVGVGRRHGRAAGPRCAGAEA